MFHCSSGAVFLKVGALEACPLQGERFGDKPSAG
jgi:hypothetical protein